jgi:hypothetical protein
LDARLGRFPASGESPVAAVSGSSVADAVSSIVVGATADNKDAGSALACREDARLRRVPVTDWPAVVEVPNSVGTFD